MIRRIRYFFLAFAIVFLLACLGISLTPFEFITNTLSERFGIGQHSAVYDVVTESVIAKFNFYLAAVSAYFFMLYWLWPKLASSTVDGNRGSVFNNPASDKTDFLLLAAPVLAMIYYGITMPITYDEAYTLNNFSSKSLLHAFASYPSPNNHVGFSVLSNIIVRIPIDDKLFLLRLPSMLFQAGNILLALQFFRRLTGSKNIAFISAAVFSTLALSIYYSYLGRGYAMQLFFFLVMLIATLQLIARDDLRAWMLFCFGAFGGMITLPSFVYAFIAVSVFLLLGRKRITVAQMVASLIILVGVALFYVPIALINGFNALTSNSVVAPIGTLRTLAALPAFLNLMIGDFTGLSVWIILILIVLAGITIFRNRSMEIATFIATLVIVPIVLMILHGVVPFSRTFNYLLIPLSLIAVLALGPLTERLKSRSPIYLAIAIQLGLLLLFQSIIEKREDYPIAANQTIAEIADRKKYFIADMQADAFLIYHLNKNKISDVNIQYGRYAASSADTITGVDFVIINSSIDRTARKKKISSNGYFNVYGGSD